MRGFQEHTPGAVGYRKTRLLYAGSQGQLYRSRRSLTRCKRQLGYPRWGVFQEEKMKWDENKNKTILSRREKVVTKTQGVLAATAHVDHRPATRGRRSEISRAKGFFSFVARPDSKSYMQNKTKNDTCITNENLLCSRGNSVLCGDLNEKEIQKKGDICVHIIGSQQKLTHHCKATIVQ